MNLTKAAAIIASIVTVQPDSSATTLNIYGDVVTDEMQQAHSKVVHLALSKQ